MKVRFKNMIQSYTGKCDGLIYYFNPRLNRTIVRSHVPQRITAHNLRFGAIAENLRNLGISAGYKSDLAVYVDAWNSKAANWHHQINNWCNIWMKLMYALGKTYYLDGFKIPDPEPDPPEHSRIDLATLTRADIYDASLPCISVKSAVEAGLIPSLRGYELLTQLM